MSPVDLRRRFARTLDPHFLSILVIGGVLAWLVLPPLLFVLQSSVVDARRGGLTLEHYATVLGAGSAGPSIVVNSITFAAGSAAVALPVGTFLAWLAERTNAPFRGAAYVAAFASFALPGIVKVTGWILLLGPRAGIVNVWLRELFGLSQGPFNIFSLAGMVLVEGLLWTPVVFLLMCSSFRSMDPALEEASSTSGAGTWHTFRHITLPLALPSALAVLLLTCARALEAFEIPALIGIPGGVPVFTTEIYLTARQGLLTRYGEASAYSVLLILLVALAIYPYYWLTRDAQSFATVTGRGFRPRAMDLGPWRLLAALPMLMVPVALVLPLLALFWASLLPFFRPPSMEALASLTLSNYPAAFANTNVSHALINSLFVSVTAATGTIFLTLVAAWLVVRTSFRGRWVLDQLATLPLVFPGIVLGIAVLRTYVTLPLPIYGTLWILVIAFISRFLPYGMRYCYAGILSLQRELEESAQLSGASWWTTLRSISVPLLMPALFAGWIYVFLITVRELSVALLLYSPGSQVISVTIWELWQNGQVSELGAFSVVLAGLLVALAMVFHRVSRRASFIV